MGRGNQSFSGPLAPHPCVQTSPSLSPPPLAIADPLPLCPVYISEGGCCCESVGAQKTQLPSGPQSAKDLRIINTGPGFQYIWSTAVGLYLDGWVESWGGAEASFLPKG